MKKVLVLMVLLLFMLACNLPVAGGQPSLEDISASQTALPTETAVPTLPFPDPSQTPSPTTLVPIIPSLTPLPLPEIVSPSNVIEFPIGGTYEDIQGSVSSGENKTYRLGAAQGQVMSVSVFGGFFPIQIKGRDGTILCPIANKECFFWRGTLPISQDYYITINGAGDQTKYTLRVAINPPGQDVQYFNYKNTATGLSLRYPDTFAPVTPVPGNYKTEPELALRFIDTQAYEKTNLSEAYLFVSSTYNSSIVATCTDPNQNGGGPEQSVNTQGVNGYTFVHTSSDGAGAGNFYQQEIYRMVNRGVCYEVIYYFHSTNVGNYTPGTVTEFDRNSIFQQLYGVFSTFTIN